jgi:hypothetical protein
VGSPCRRRGTTTTGCGERAATRIDTEASTSSSAAPVAELPRTTSCPAAAARSSELVGSPGTISVEVGTPGAVWTATVYACAVIRRARWSSGDGAAVVPRRLM